MIRSYTFSSDPGHGWLRVSAREIQELGIAGEITHFSYVSDSGRWVWLEEDCDAATFVSAKARQLGVDSGELFSGSHCRMKGTSSNNVSRIRSLRSYHQDLLRHGDSTAHRLPRITWQVTVTRQDWSEIASYRVEAARSSRSVQRLTRAAFRKYPDAHGVSVEAVR